VLEEDNAQERILRMIRQQVINSITYEYSTSEFPTDYASTTDADAPKRYGTERRRMHLNLKLKQRRNGIEIRF